MCRRHFRLPHFAFRLPHFAFRLSPSAFRLPHSAFRRNAVPCREDRECYPSVLCSDGCVATLLVLRTIQVKQIPCAANKRSAVERHYKKGALHPLFLTAPPYPHSCDWSPVKNRPLRMPGERFPEHIKRRSVKKKVRKETENPPEISLFSRRGSGCCG